jgi:hypothetical protein
MRILTVSEVKHICKQMFGTTAVIANESCGYATNSGVYFCAAGTWFKVDTETWLGTPIDNSENIIIMFAVMLAKENNMLAEVCESFLEQSTGSDANDFFNALKEWDLI